VANKAKFLEVIVDNKLDFMNHVDVTCNKLSRFK